MGNNNTISVGIIGAGFIGPVHVEGLRRNPNLVRVDAIAAMNQQEANEAAEKMNISLAYGDYRNLLANPDIDSVHICTPNFLHYSIAREALEAGKNVLCEKPLALTVEEAEKLVLLSDNTGLAAGVHYNLRYYPMAREMEERVRKGTVGEIFSIHGSYLQDWLLFDTDYSWRLDAASGGESRAVADIGTHWMDIAQMISGLEITEVCADFSIAYPVRKKPIGDVTTFSSVKKSENEYEKYKVNTEDSAAILLRFSNGAKGSLSVSQVAAGRKNRLIIEIDGSEEALAWNSEAPNELWVGKRDEANQLILKDPAQLGESAITCSSYPGGHQEGFGETSKNYFRDFYTYILNKESDSSLIPAFPTFRDGLKEMLLCEAIIESAATSRWIEVRNVIREL